MVKCCPNPQCRFSCPANCATERFSKKKGYYVTKYNHQRVPRYQCRECGKWFSSHTFRDTYGQKKPHLNAQVYQLYCSAVTQRRAARLLGINRKTVVRKFLFLAAQARKAHEQALKGFDLGRIQFDEMESFEHTRLKPLALALAVEEGGKILAAKVAQMPYKGPLAGIARKKYGYRHDTRPQVRKEVLETLQARANGRVRLTTDADPAYPVPIRKYFPQARHLAVPAKQCHPVRRLAQRRRNHDDPLFAVNHCAAKIRHDLSRMARRVWTTTKRASRLQDHLDLYTAYLNGYSL